MLNKRIRILLVAVTILPGCVTTTIYNYPRQQEAPQFHYYQEELLEQEQPVKYRKIVAPIDPLLGGYR